MGQEDDWVGSGQRCGSAGWAWPRRPGQHTDWGRPAPHAELVRSCPQWSPGTSSGQSCPGGPTMCRTCRRHSGHDSRRRTSDSGASSAPARPPASRPRPSHPRSDKAVYRPVCLCPHEPGNLSHARPAHVSPAASPRAGGCVESTVGRGTHGPLGLSKLGRYPHLHAVPSDPERVGRSGVRVSAWSFVTSPWGARGQGWSPGSPEISSGTVLGRAGPRVAPRPHPSPSDGDPRVRIRMGQMRRLQRARAAATPTPPVTAVITQW